MTALWTAAELRAATGGTLDAEVAVTGVSIDTRTIAPGDLFVALRDVRDGHDFVAEALARGAACALVDRDPPGVAPDAPLLRVDDTLTGLTVLGAAARARSAAVFVGITGSVGKTTAKDLMAVVLRGRGSVVSPPGSFNNELGLPLTVLEADADTDFLVLEMGARGKGHIAYLCEVAPPRIGVELVVGTAHVGEFGGQDAIAEAKAELVRALPPEGIAVLNRDDPAVAAMADVTSATVLWFGRGPGADVTASDLDADDLDRATFSLRTPQGDARVTLRYIGAHAVPNALAAASVGHAVGMGAAEIAEALSAAEPTSRWRMEVTRRPDGVTVINDAYNASPESVRAALKSLKQIAGPRRSWAVLGEMRELGDQSVAEHDAIGRLVVRLDVQRLVVVGEGARPMQQAAALEGSWGQESIYVPDVQGALEVLRAELRPDDVVLVKASRAAGLEAVAAELLGEVPA